MHFDSMSIEQALLAAVGGLTSAVVFLFLWFRNQFNLILVKLQECEDDREELWNRLTGGKPKKPERA